MSMRISTDKRDPGYVKFAELMADGYRITITLNGVVVPGVVTADEDSGEFISVKYTAEGNPICVEDVIVYERTYGDVKIKVDRPNDTRVLH